MNILKSKLFGKIFILLIISVTLTLFIFIYGAKRWQKESIEYSLYTSAKSIAESISFVKSDSIIIDNEIDLLEFVLDFVKSENNILNFLIIKNNGNNILIEKNSWKLVEFNNDKYKSINQIYYDIEKSKWSDKKVFRFVYPIKVSGVEWGFFDIELSLKEYNKKVIEANDSLLLLALIMFVLSVFLAYYISNLITRPIAKLSDLALSIAEGKLSKRVEIAQRDDEIGVLANSFNNMLENLEKSQNALKQSHLKLENKVEQRTEELTKTNNLLKEKSEELSKINENLENMVYEETNKRRKQEEILIQQSKLASMGEMIGNIAHQWRQPLNALSLVLQNLNYSYMLGDLDDEQMDSSTKKANLLISTMSKTIDDFRNFFKPNKNKVKFLASKSVEKSIKMLDSTFISNEIEIDYNFISEKNIHGFPNEFSQVVLNIMTNAKDALLDKNIKNAKVELVVDSSEKYVYVYINDNAGGIDEDIMKKIFDPYFTTKAEGKGTGIGLYMSKVIIENNMQGKLDVKKIENGSSFMIKMPIYEEVESD